MMHDFAITDRHADFLDLPMTFQPARLATGMPFGWDEAYGARLRVMALDRPGDVAWVEVEPDVTGPPVATVELPRGVPSGIHGSWIDEADLETP